MEIDKWLEIVVQPLVSEPEKVLVTKAQLGSTIWLKVHLGTESDQRKLAGKDGENWHKVKNIVWMAAKEAGLDYRLDGHFGLNREASQPAIQARRQTLPEEDPDAIAREFMAAATITPETMTRADVIVMAAWADKDWPEVRAYLLAQFGDRMMTEALQALRGGVNG